MQCSTPYGNQRKITYGLLKQSYGKISPCSTPYGNQRKITSNSKSTSTILVCAQRLTAIRGKSHRANWLLFVFYYYVLNALRQSEENHLGTWLASWLKIVCSTPYGNQRKITGLEQATEEDIKTCSTPYGNQRKITIRSSSDSSFSRKSAQRLTAIRGKSPV